MITVYALLWSISGYLFGLAVISFFGVTTDVGIYCGAINLILGLMALLWIHRSPRLSHLFYEGPREDESGSLLIAFLWSLPLAILFWALVTFVLSWLTKQP